MTIINSKYYLFFIAILLVTKSRAQQPEVALAKAIYKFTYVIDTTMKSNPLQREMVLYMNMHASLYRNVMDEESKLLLHLSKGGSKATFDILEESAALTQLAGKSNRVERLVDNMYIISENQIKIDWKLHDDIKDINGYAAQKATADIYGRHYTVWFTSEIPFQSGPWKLRGLPGLILDAQDDKGEVIFKFESFQLIDKNALVKIGVPKSFKIKKVSFKEYEKIYTAYYDDPAAFIKASLGITDDKKIINGNKSQTERRYNNPIEIRR